MHPASSGPNPAGPRRVAFFGGSFDPPHLGHLAIARAARQALHLDRILFAPVGLQPLKPSGSSASFEDRVAMTRLAIAADPSFEISLLDAPQTAAPPTTQAIAHASAPNYTADTLAHLRQSLPENSDLFLLFGEDSFRTLQHWHRAAEIPFLAGLIVAARPASGAQAPADSSPPLSIRKNPASLLRYLPKGISSRPLPGHPYQFQLTNSAGQQSLLVILPDLHYDVSATQLRSQLRSRAESHPQHSTASPTPLLDPAVLNYIREHHLYARPTSRKFPKQQ
jgi:nicotinate-nucleotide adenylyltransferase